MLRILTTDSPAGINFHIFLYWALTSAGHDVNTKLKALEWIRQHDLPYLTHLIRQSTASYPSNTTVDYCSTSETRILWFKPVGVTTD